MKYELISSDLAIRDEDGVIRWRGRPDGYPVKALSPVPGNVGAVVLLDYLAGPKNFPNLMLVGPDGLVTWRAPLPDTAGNDAYVEFRWDGDDLLANTWSGYLIRIDPMTGSLKDRVYVK
jgi:hypothetical protein